MAKTNGVVSFASAAATPRWKDGFRLRTTVPGPGPNRPVPEVAWNEAAANSCSPSATRARPYGTASNAVIRSPIYNWRSRSSSAKQSAL
jgi:hypothetical protein